MPVEFIGQQECDLVEGQLIDVASSSLYGRLWAPQTLGEYAGIVEGLTARTENPPGGWRGQSDAGWALHSSAYRRLLNSSW